jgi:hypothetical protein
VFRALSAAIHFGPQLSVSYALEFVNSHFVLSSSETNDETKADRAKADECAQTFLTYVTSFKPLFELPPPTGWSSGAWTGLNQSTGINLETIPLTAATSSQAHLLRLARDYRAAMADLHTGFFRWFGLRRHAKQVISLSCYSRVGHIYFSQWCPYADGKPRPNECGCGSFLVPSTPARHTLTAHTVQTTHTAHTTYKTHTQHTT